MPAVHIGAAERRRGDFDQQRARIEIGNGHLLDRQRFVMFGDDSGAASVHGVSFRRDVLLEHLKPLERLEPFHEFQRFQGSNRIGLTTAAVCKSARRCARAWPLCRPSVISSLSMQFPDIVFAALVGDLMREVGGVEKWLVADGF